MELLQKDGRRSYAAIAKEVGLSEAAVRQLGAAPPIRGDAEIVALSPIPPLGFPPPCDDRARTDLATCWLISAMLSPPSRGRLCRDHRGEFSDLLCEVVCCEDDDHLFDLT